MKTNIVLIGFMGAGKTEVGKILAKNKGFNFIDLDCLIEKKEGAAITEIFKKKGENYFRNLETEILKELDKNKSDISKILEKYTAIHSKESKNWVISTGGGMPAFNIFILFEYFRHASCHILDKHRIFISMFGQEPLVFPL